MIDWTAMHYDPLYDALGQSARLYPAASSPSVAVMALDKTGGVEVSDGSSVDVGTIRPAAVVRKREMLDAGVTLDDLPGATIALSGKFWEVKSFFPRPAPSGEADGEIYLILIEGDGPDGSA